MKYFDDIEKIRDLAIMGKDEFLDSYSYLDDEDYDYYNTWSSIKMGYIKWK